jgi:subtilisin-like proprotein convertase family protein
MKLNLLQAIVALSLCASAHAASVSGSNAGNVTIPDAGGYVSSTITISGAPAGATVTGIDVYFKCVHPYSGDLTVDLNADSTGSLGNYRIWNREGGAADNPTRTTTGISTFNGLSVNRTWYLYAKDWEAGDSGYIDEWTITIYYSASVTPSISSVSPASPIGSNSPQPFTINGNNFVSGCTVTLRDLTTAEVFANRPISSQTGTQITINPNFTTAAHNWSVEVINPGNASSGQFNFTVQAPTVTPTITSVLPNPVTGSNSKQTFTVNGSGFISGAQVKLVWPAVGVAPAGNATLSATFVNDSQLQVSATFGNDPATWMAQVINPGNVTSSTYNFQLQAPLPIIQFLSPNSVAPGGSTFTLAVNGSTFNQSSVVRWNGVNLTTTPVVSSGGLTTVLNAQVPASYIASAGAATVTVFNPSPGGGASAGVNFNIDNNISTSSQGVDYSANHPNLNALKAAGYSFVIRYVSAAGNAKNITSSEAQALQAAGLNIILVFEGLGDEMLSGYSQGVADANTAVTQATAAGAPQNFFCYFACDFDAQPSDQTAINAYLDGAASVLGVQRVGFYGGYAPLKNVLDAGKAAKG